MLPIKGKEKAAPPVEEQAPIGEAPPVAELPVEELAPPMPEAPVEAPGGSVDPIVAGYMGPDMGPFMCGNCVHYKAPGACNIVSGPIDPEGLCQIYTPVPQETESPEEAIPSEESAMPMEG